MAERGPVQSVARALELLEAVVAEREAGLGRLVELTGLSPSTAHRLLASLIAAGYVTHAPGGGGGYRIGAHLESLAGIITNGRVRLVDLARPRLLELRDRFDETVNLVELNGWNARYVDQVESSHPVRMFNQLGNQVPLHTSAAGKAMLAAQPERIRRAFLARAPFERMTENTVVDAEPMAAELELIERRGYAFDHQERDEGVVCVAAAIRLGDGAPAALSVSGPAHRMARLDLDSVGSALSAASAEISTESGLGATARTS